MVSLYEDNYNKNADILPKGFKKAIYNNIKHETKKEQTM